MRDPWSAPAVPPRSDGPLIGRRVLITRPRSQGSGLAARLAELGATTLLLPVLEIAPPASFRALDSAIAELGSFDLVVLTSANAVDAFAGRLPAGSSYRRLAVIGPATLARVHELQLPSPIERPILVPPQAIGESLAESLEPLLCDLLRQQGSARVLLPRAEQARELLPERLRATGAELTVVPAYRNQVPPESAPLLRQLLAERHHWPDAIPFTSSSSVTNLLALLEPADTLLPDAITRISIGPVTSATLREHGLPPHAEAARPTVESLAEAVLDTLSP